MKHVHPGFDRRAQRTQAIATLPLRRDGGVVDQRVERRSRQPLLDFGDRARHRAVIAKFDLYMVVGSGVPGAAHTVERLARTGDDPPARLREQFSGAWPMPREAPVST